ncbi:phospholipid phosphatase 5 [Aethina tumida]|uniref:phospholipid phosphatase 5 n=1 Tax=Aethina tumida TaxID=116153 RepID=UPI00096B1866|nr:phospholipid phosphatase 5 [Aethina tumida]
MICPNSSKRINYFSFLHNGNVKDVLIEIACRFALWILFAILERQEPFIRIIDEEELWMYKYPVVSSYVRARYLWQFVIFVPAVVFLLEFIYYYHDEDMVEEIKNDIAALTLAYPISGIITSALKVTVGRPRPNFFYRCFPDGFGTSLTSCTGSYSEYMDGRRSFPSGHASFAFTSMVYLTLNLTRILNIRHTQNNKAVRLIFCVLPVFLATLIAVSRTCDYHHHYSDAIAGALIGSSVASFVYWAYNNYIMVEDPLSTKTETNKYCHAK